MFFNKKKGGGRIVDIPLADHKGLRRMDPGDARKILENYMKEAGGKYEIRHREARAKGRESFMPFDLLELVLHDAGEDKKKRIEGDLKKIFDWKSPRDK